MSVRKFSEYIKENADEGIKWIQEPQDKEKNISILDDKMVIMWIPEYAEDGAEEYKLLTNYISKGFVITDIHVINNEEHKYNYWKKLKLEKR